MYYALPEYLRETTLPLFRVCCLFIRRKTAGLGLVMGFSIVCKKRQGAMDMLTSTEAGYGEAPSVEAMQKRSLPEIGCM